MFRQRAHLQGLSRILAGGVFDVRTNPRFNKARENFMQNSSLT